MNSLAYDYDFISYMNSLLYKFIELWIHVIISYMNSCIHDSYIVHIESIDYEFICRWIQIHPEYEFIW